ncbi:efflux RND transporter permease subunit [Halopseudomonas nanhaiensis]|uniref:efflux RND transporter permease subunit n=1 Tax=Halopseudomonas nanhaiensis TaxID=2830842 RepID=UPI001CC0D34F|nr:efflux RND transporter permease subunit [Halopseudomonas nanhaiensis]UAW97241.1 efflux RND transporter permease subunit [Halopseudomonas nanhaiensis]
MDFARYAIYKPVNVWLLVLLCLVGGTMAFFEMGRLEDPEFTIKQAIVNLQYPGATALEVEQQITEPLETAIQQMTQVKEIRSRSMPGMSEIQVEIQDRYTGDELEQIWDELRNKLDGARGDLPPDAPPPVVNDDFGDVFGVYYALTGEGLTLRELHDTAKSLRLALLTTEGVGQVELAGEQEERISVLVDEARLAALRLSPEEIVAALADADAVVDAGGVPAGELYVRLRPSGDFNTLDTLRALPVGRGQATVSLGSIATIERGYAERPAQIVRFNGEPAITLGISGISGSNIVEVGQRVEATIEAETPNMPLGATLHPIYQQHRVVDDSVNSFALNVFLSVGIVVGVLCLAMGLRAGLVIGAVLFLTVLGTLLVMWIGGIELERISLGALIIAMGMLVDNAVVVCDGVLVQRQRGLSVLEASRKTLEQTQIPLLGSTIIGILAFAGIGLSQDTTGEFLFSLFYVIAVSLLLSWIIALLVVPLLCELLLGNRSDAEADGAESYSGPLYDRFRTVARFVLRFRLITVVALVLMTVASGFAFSRLPQSFFPPSSTPLFYVTGFLAQGTHIRDTSRTAEDVRSFVQSFDGVTDVSTFVGAGASRFMLTYTPEQPNSSLLHLLVRVEDAEAIGSLVRELNQQLPSRYPAMDVAATQFLFGPNPEAKLEARISGPSIETLRELAETGVRLLETEGQVINVRYDWRERVSVLRPLLDLDRLAEAGLTRQSVARSLAVASEGSQVSLFREEDELIPILLRASAEDRLQPDGLLQRLIWSPASGSYLPLAQVADGVEVQPQDTLIRRFDRQRTIGIRAEPRDGENTNAAFQRIRPIIESIDLPPGYTLEWGGDHEQSSEAQAALIGTIALPYLGMMLITVLLFGRVRQPLMIWAVVPMSIIGVSVGLHLAGQSFGFMALLGLLSLTGMLIKNAVVLVDETDRQIAEDVPRMTAIVEASASRLRPVAMAAGTTVLGMVPLLFDPFFANMAVTIMGGLSFATVLTLLAVPCLYAILMRVRQEETA